MTAYLVSSNHLGCSDNSRRDFEPWSICQHLDLHLLLLPLLTRVAPTRVFPVNSWSVGDDIGTLLVDALIGRELPRMDQTRES